MTPPHFLGYRSCPHPVCLMTCRSTAVPIEVCVSRGIQHLSNSCHARGQLRFGLLRRRGATRVRAVHSRMGVARSAENMSVLGRSFVVLTCVLGPSARSQTAALPSASDFAVREWHGEDGLPHEDVLQLLQDRSGYLWVACRGALCRFDGTTFMLE